MHTETEAKELWCPFARSIWRDGDSGVAANRGPTEDGCRCIASECMAWRWVPLMADQPFMDAVKKRMDESKDKHPVAVKYVRANLTEFGLPDKPFRGHCGLAGKP